MHIENIFIHTKTSTWSGRLLVLIDFKFHIFSLVAIFLALGIGIVVGITLIGDDSLIQEQKVIIDRLEEEFNLLRAESRETQQEIVAFKNSNDVYQQFAQSVLPILVEKRLDNRNIAIINTNNYVSTDSLEKSLELAGANVISLTNINTSFDFSSEKVGALLETNLGIQATKNTNELIISTVKYIGQGILYGFEPEKLTFLQEVKLVEFRAGNLLNLDCVIILGGKHVKDDNLVKAIDLTLITLFLENGVEVVAAEQSEVPYSSIAHYKTKGITTVDNIETPLGQIALVYALDGMPGHYGVKETAEKILPDLNEIAVRSSMVQ